MLNLHLQAINQALRSPLYQVQVETKDGRPVFVGPAVSEPEPLYKLATAINLSVAKGREPEWRNAHVVQLSTTRN